MFKVVTTWTAPQGGPYFTNVYYSGTGAAQAQEAHEAMVDFWELWPVNISSAYEPTVVGEVTEYDEATGLPTAVHQETPVTIPMTSSGQPLPFATQGLIRIATNSFNGAVRTRGRIFIPGLTEAITQGGAPDTASVNTVSGLVEAWRAGLGPTTVGVWSREHLVFAAASGLSMWEQFAVLRSRRD